MTDQLKRQVKEFWLLWSDTDQLWRAMLSDFSILGPCLQYEESKQAALKACGRELREFEIAADATGMEHWVCNPDEWAEDELTVEQLNGFIDAVEESIKAAGGEVVSPTDRVSAELKAAGIDMTEANRKLYAMMEEHRKPTEEQVKLSSLKTCDWDLKEVPCEECKRAEAGETCYFISDGGEEPRDGTYLCKACALKRFS